MPEQVEHKEISEMGAYYTAFAELYRVLSAGLSRPHTELVRSVQSGNLLRFLNETLAPMNHELLNQTLVELGDYTQEVSDKDTERVRLALEVEYNRLFVGPGTVLVAPYESRFIPDACGSTQLMSQVTVSVVCAYEQAGLALPLEYADMPDHIAAELSFVSSLALQVATLPERAGRAEELLSSFIDEHLSKWVCPFSEMVHEHTTKAFYQAMATLTSVLVSLS